MVAVSGFRMVGRMADRRAVSWATRKAAWKAASLEIPRAAQTVDSRVGQMAGWLVAEWAEQKAETSEPRSAVN